MDYNYIIKSKSSPVLKIKILSVNESINISKIKAIDDPIIIPVDNIISLSVNEYILYIYIYIFFLSIIKRSNYT